MPRRPTTDCCCDFAFPNTENDDHKFLQEIASYAIRDVPVITDGNVQIDTRRIYMTGHSNGCMVSLSVSMLYNFTTAVACFSGALLTPNPENYKPLPFWFVHGADDDMLPYDGVSFTEKRASVKATHKFLSDLNQCEKFSHKEILNGTASIDNSTLCKNEASVELMTLNDVGKNKFDKLFIFDTLVEVQGD